jgi:hypothetical protein
MERLTLFATGQTVNSASFVNISGLTTANVGVGTYHVKGIIMLNVTTLGGAIELEWNGSCTVSSMRVFFKETIIGSPHTNGAAIFVSALGSAFTGAVTASTVNRAVEFDGQIVVSVAGSFQMSVATTVAADAFAIPAAGSYLELFPVA